MVFLQIDLSRFRLNFLAIAMVNLTKKILDPHEIFVDTNVLHVNDKKDLVSQDFEAFWENHILDLELTLVVPYVVYGELLFQLTSSALTTFKRAEEAINRLSAASTINYGHRITESRVRRDIKNRLDSWLLNKKAETLPTPVHAIEWDRLIEDSIWRKPPFYLDPKKEDVEKGFRDSIILETLVFHAKENQDKTIIFLSGDNLLRESVSGRLKKASKVKVMESLEDVDAYFKLMRENFTEEFVDSIIDKASLKFLNNKDRNSLVFKEKLGSKLVKLAGELITNPGAAAQLKIDGFESGEEWSPTSKGRFNRVGKSQFISLENGHTFNWKEDVRYNRSFEVVSWDGECQKVELEIEFVVKWKSNVSENERFTKVEYIDSELVSSSVINIDV